MEICGLEIRKRNGLLTLYQDVDRVVKELGIEDGGVPHDMKAGGVAHSLQKMMRPDKWFDVCTVNQCAKLSGIVIPYERQKLYDATHCVHWNEMLPEFRNKLVLLLLDDFRNILNPNEE